MRNSAKFPTVARIAYEPLLCAGFFLQNDRGFFELFSINFFLIYVNLIFTKKTHLTHLAFKRIFLN